MKLFFIAYDLLTPGKDYKRLFDKLESIGARRVLLSTWALKGNYTAVQLRDTLKEYIDANDRLLVVQSADWASRGSMTDINKV
jgi:hypothetical protein